MPILKRFFISKKVVHIFSNYFWITILSRKFILNGKKKRGRKMTVINSLIWLPRREGFIKKVKLFFCLIYYIVHIVYFGYFSLVLLTKLI